MKDTLDFLENLVGFDTQNPQGNEGECAEFLKQCLRAHQPTTLAVQRVPRLNGTQEGAYVVAAWGEPKLWVNVHLDTVPASPGWNTHPWTLTVHNDRAIGLGAADTKGAIAALLAAMQEVAPNQVGVLFSGDEERSQTCLRAFLDSRWAHSVQDVLVCEPTSLQVGVRHRGIATFELMIEGPGGHSSLADEIRAPLLEMGVMISDLAQWSRSQRTHGQPGLQGMCLNIGQIEGGVAANVIPTAARMLFSVRPPPTADMDEVVEQISTLIKKTAPPFQFSVSKSNPPFQSKNPSVVCERLGEYAQSVVDLAFWTEAALFAQRGINAVVWGPGEIAQAHAPNEYVAISELHKAKSAFIRLLKSLST